MTVRNGNGTSEGCNPAAAAGSGCLPWSPERPGSSPAQRRPPRETPAPAGPNGTVIAPPKLIAITGGKLLTITHGT